MASKILLFLLAFVLLFSTKVMSVEEEVLTEKDQHHHAKAPAPAPVYSHSPKKAPAHAPKKAPTHAPKKAPTHAPKKAPTYPPKRAPAHPPTVAPTHPPQHAPHHPPTTAPAYPPSHPNHGNCVASCAAYCNTKPATVSKRLCQRACVPCCDHYKCVPGHSTTCSNWGSAVTDAHGRVVKCP